MTHFKRCSVFIFRHLDNDKTVDSLVLTSRFMVPRVAPSEVLKEELRMQVCFDDCLGYSIEHVLTGYKFHLMDKQA